MLNVLSGKSKVKRSCSPAVAPRAALESISRALFMFLGEKSSHGMQPTCPLCRQGHIFATSNAGAQSGQTQEHPKQSMKPTHVSVRVSQWLSGKESTWNHWVPSLGREDPLKEGMATHSSILAWRVQWTEEPRGPPGTLGCSQRVRHD